jgi:hypothetical protein
MLNEAIKMAKGEDEEKIGFSIKLPKSLKEDLVALANGNDVSTNALIVSILDIAVNSKEIVSSSITGKAIVSEIKHLNFRKQQILDMIEENGGLSPDIGDEVRIRHELDSLNSTLDILKGLV